MVSYRDSVMKPGHIVGLLGAAGLVLGALAVLPGEAAAQTLLNLESSTKDGNTTWSVPIQTLLFFTALSFIPAAVLLMTSFTRIIIVLSLLRQAMGLQASPPNQVLVGIALFLTAFIMSPTIDRIYVEAYQPFSEKRLDFESALKKGSEPLRSFMLKQTRTSDLELFANLARVETGTDGKAVAAKDMPFKVIVPAFVISELKTAFQIGFMIFIPFIMIDLICASVLMSLGMMMVSPILVALPFKLVLFVLADGWNLLVGSLVASFAA
ncbi:MAG: flagellar type III secretion system pore protein FliP [Lautropia sp.]|nr:flagellar type III secretion system pore protein FliP [Lautropia sp.]